MGVWYSRVMHELLMIKWIHYHIQTYRSALRSMQSIYHPDETWTLISSDLIKQGSLLCITRHLIVPDVWHCAEGILIGKQLKRVNYQLIIPKPIILMTNILTFSWKYYYFSFHILYYGIWHYIYCVFICILHFTYV